jgi:hypothetical protein
MLLGLGLANRRVKNISLSEVIFKWSDNSNWLVMTN